LSEEDGGKADLNLKAKPNHRVYAYDEHVPRASAFCHSDFLLISAGFDAHKGDPLAGILFDESTYAEITWMLTKVAEKYCKGRIVQRRRKTTTPSVSVTMLIMLEFASWGIHTIHILMPTSVMAIISMLTLEHGQKVVRTFCRN